MREQYDTLLQYAELLNKTYQGKQKDSFNLFTVLRSASDEVRLHSRFLAALLDYQESEGAKKEFVADLIDHLGINAFDVQNVSVETEVNNIDILIKNDQRQAVVIENKIHAGDQERQLERYWTTLRKQGMQNIFLVYLTLNGDEPSENSIGDLKDQEGFKPSSHLWNISYKHALPPWLKACQQKACNIPFLRESIAQYLQVIRKLTGTDINESYMSELSNLLLKDNNLLLVHDLNEAVIPAMIKLQKKLWEDIEKAVDIRLPDLPEGHKKTSVTEARIERFCRLSRLSNSDRYYGLYYQIPNSPASLGIELEDHLYVGIICEKEHQEEYQKLKEQLKELGFHSSKTWPSYHGSRTPLSLKNPSRDQLALLVNDEARKKFAAELAEDARLIWQSVTSADKAE